MDQSEPRLPFVGGYVIDPQTGQMFQVEAVISPEARELLVSNAEGDERVIRVRRVTSAPRAAAVCEFRWCPDCESWVKPRVEWITGGSRGWPELPVSVCPHDDGSREPHRLLEDMPPGHWARG